MFKKLLNSQTEFHKWSDQVKGMTGGLSPVSNPEKFPAIAVGELDSLVFVYPSDFPSEPPLEPVLSWQDADLEEYPNHTGVQFYQSSSEETDIFGCVISLSDGKFECRTFHPLRIGLTKVNEAEAKAWVEAEAKNIATH